MSIVTETQQILTAAKLPEVDHIYVNNIPREAQDSTKTTDLLISEAGNDPDEYGNNDFHSLAQSVEVEVFYCLDVAFETDAFEVKLMQLLMHHGYTVRVSRPHLLDPDTLQLSKVFYFDKTKYLKE